MKCLLRSYRLDDLERLRRLADDFSVVQWMGLVFPYPYTAEAAKSWIERALAASPPNNLVIEVDGVMAGDIGIAVRDGLRQGVGELGYWVGRDYWGRGIVTEAIRLFVNYAFGERRLRRLEAHIFAPNVASARVLEKNGFVLEGVFKDRVTDRQGNIHDELFYALLSTNDSRCDRSIRCCACSHGRRHDL